MLSLLREKEAASHVPLLQAWAGRERKAYRESTIRRLIGSSSHDQRMHSQSDSQSPHSENCRKMSSKTGEVKLSGPNAEAWGLGQAYRMEAQL